MPRGIYEKTPEHREKLRQAQLGRKDSVETRQRKRQAQLQPGTREENRQRALKQWADPKAREEQRQRRLRQKFPATETKIERALYHEFRKRRLKFEMHKAMFERFQPDFVFESAKLVVQADGGYWHSRKNPRNLAYDVAFNRKAIIEGWTVFRFSDTEIKMHVAACAKAVARFIRCH